MSSNQLNPYKMLEQKLRYLGYVGLNPMRRTRFGQIFSILIIGLLFMTFILTGIYCCTMKFSINGDATIGDATINLVLFGAVWQMLLKTSFFYRKRDRLKRLITQLYDEYWAPDFVDEKLAENIQFIYKLYAILDFSLTAGVALSVIGHSITAILRGNYNMPVNIWLPKPVRFIINSNPYYIFFTAFNFFYINTSTICCVLQADLLLAMVIAMTIVQLKLMKYKLMNIEDKNKKERKKEMAKIINHHNLLFEMLAEVEELFSPVLLQLLGTSMLLIVISFLTALFSDQLTQRILFIYVGSTAFGQFAMYCFLGQFLQDETESVADIAYLCNWEDSNDTEMGKCLVIIMQRSQKRVNISIGKFIVLNLENFTRVSKTMFSFFTFVINMKMD